MAKGLSIGSIIKCADNSGAKVLQIISVTGYKGKRRSRAETGVAGLVTCRVITGNESVRHEVFKVVIIRQRREYQRTDGTRVSFDDNAGVIVTDKMEPKGTLIKGPIAKEVVERFPIVAKVASIVV